MDGIIRAVMWDSVRIVGAILTQTDRQRLVATTALFAVIPAAIDLVMILAEENTMDIPVEKLIAFMWGVDDGFPLWWQGDSITWMVKYIDDFYRMDINPVGEVFKNRKIFVWEGKCEHWDSVNGPRMRGVWRNPTVEELALLTVD
jgi:hypothetical protein